MLHRPSVIALFVLLLACEAPESAGSPDASRPDASRPDASHPDASGPDATIDQRDGGVPTIQESVGTPPGPARGAGLPPVVLWPRPAHAHPEVPFEFTFVAYDPEHEALRFALEGAPDGMTVSAGGTVRWPRPIAGTHELVLRVDDGRDTPVEVPFTLEVDPSHFVFVSPDGRDEGAGTLDDPLRDIEAALVRVRELGFGTVFLRGGTYPIHWSWEQPGRPSPLRGARGTQARPFALRGYPGERVILDCEGRGNGPWSFGAEYVIFADFEVRNANSEERGGIVLEQHALAQSVTVRDSNWDRSTNCTGFILRGEDAICHRCRGIDNFDRNSDHWNSSNYLVYLDGEGARGTRYILDSLSSGSIVGFKVKHAGPARLLLHGSRSMDDELGVAVADDGSEIAYCTVERADTGLTFGLADPNEFTRGEVSFHHNTVVESRIGFAVQTTYGDRDASEVRANVFATSASLGSTEDATLMTFVWPYEAAPPIDLRMDENCYAAPALDTGFRFGRTTTSFAEWQGRGFDGASVATEALAFTDGLRIPAGSACAAIDAGAWR